MSLRMGRWVGGSWAALTTYTNIFITAMLQLPKPSGPVFPGSQQPPLLLIQLFQRPLSWEATLEATVSLEKGSQAVG